jgi:hypothetical protein
MSPEAPPLTPEDAQAEIARRMADPKDPYLNPGTPRHEAAVGEIHALYRVAAGADNRGLLVFADATDAGPVPPAQGGAPLPLERPTLTGGAQWDDALVASLGSALADAGLPAGIEHALLAVLAEAHNDGSLVRGTPESCAAQLEAKYGAAEMEALIDDAARGAEQMPPVHRRWLAQQKIFTHPGLTRFVADLWRRSRHRAP